MPEQVMVQVVEEQRQDFQVQDHREQEEMHRVVMDEMLLVEDVVVAVVQEAREVPQAEEMEEMDLQLLSHFKKNNF